MFYGPLTKVEWQRSKPKPFFCCQVTLSFKANLTSTTAKTSPALIVNLSCVKAKTFNGSCLIFGYLFKP